MGEIYGRTSTGGLDCVTKLDFDGGKDMLKIGDKVIMNDKYKVSEINKRKVFVVITEPQEVCGTMSVWLDGYRGCYAMDGLTKIN